MIIIKRGGNPSQKPLSAPQVRQRREGNACSIPYWLPWVNVFKSRQCLTAGRK
jgi:hypothetical protein